MIMPIRYFGDPVLRRRASPVRRFDESLRTLASDMIETMHEDHGVGLAAPQVGVALRLFVASEYRHFHEEDAEHVADHVLVNPRIVERDGNQVVQEGCLSIPGLYVEDMSRDLRVKVRYQDLDGNEHELDAEGHFAQVLQHESDHLDGVLFFDRLPEDRRRAFLEENRGELAEIQRRAKALLRRLRSEGAEAGHG